MKVFGLFAFFYTGLLLIFTNSAFADWHSWDNPPEYGQLYMYVILEPCAAIKDRQHLIITRYNPENPEYHYEHNGWWDVTPETVWEWMQEGNRMFYTP